MYKGILAQMSRHLVCHFHCKSLINMIRINLNQWTLNIKYTLYQKQSYLASRHFSKFHVRTTILCFSTDSSLQKFFLFENFFKKNFYRRHTRLFSSWAGAQLRYWTLLLCSTWTFVVWSAFWAPKCGSKPEEEGGRRSSCSGGAGNKSFKIVSFFVWIQTELLAV